MAERGPDGRFVSPALGVDQKILRERRAYESPEVNALLEQIDTLYDGYVNYLEENRAEQDREVIVDEVEALLREALALINETAMPAMDKARLYTHVGTSFTLDLSDGAFVNSQKTVRHDLLPEVLGASIYTHASKELARLLQDGPVSAALIEDDEAISSFVGVPDEVRHEIIARFCDLGLIKYEKDTIIFGNNKKAAHYMATGAVETARLVSRIFSADVPNTFNSLDDVAAAHARHNDARRVTNIEVRGKKDSVKILPINELRLGHQDSEHGLALVRSTIDMLREFSAEELPDVILVTNLIQGDFAHHQARRRAALVEGMDTNSEQFRIAQLLLDELRTLGIPIVVSLGRDDHAIAVDYTKDVMRELNGIAKEGSKENFIPYYESNKLMQDQRFQDHLRFQLRYIMPLCYTIGRRLRTAAEVSKATGGEIDHSEYIALYAHIVHGESLPAELGIEPEVIKQLGEWRKGICFVDDANLTLQSDTGEPHEVWYRHSVSFTPETLLANHMSVLLDILGTRGTNGLENPDLIMSGGAQEAVYATRNDSGAVVLPGLTDPNEYWKRGQYSTAVPGDPSRRLNLLRKRPNSPALYEVELKDTGEIIHTYISKEIMEKADSLPRMGIFELCDFQIGSPTARPDYQIKYLSYMLETATRMPIAIQFAGDIIHGHIYPGFSDESQAQGLIRLKSQKATVEKVMRAAFMNAPQALLDAVVDVLVQQGNHDEVQRTRIPNNNDSNVDYLMYVMRDLVDTPGEETKVRHDAIYHTPTGVPVPTWMGTSHYGAYTVKTAHYHLDRGAKGNTGGLPAYHAYQRAVGLGTDERADLLLGAHWHNPQVAMLGRKVVVVGGAMAEQSQFEDKLGYSARLAGSVVFLGGGKPLEVMFVGRKALDNHGVRHGFFTPENLAAHGYFDDPGFDVAKHGPHSRDDMPKSAQQKAYLRMARAASQLTDFETPQANPNGGGVQNKETRRIYAAAGRLATRR